jgi:CheY-like chemotaxis protein
MEKTTGTDNRIPRVLVVEDSKLNRMVIMQMLKRTRAYDGAEDSGGSVGEVAEGVGPVGTAIVGEEAASARQAIEMLRTERYDLVLMDIQMPDTDGLEATRAIRAGEAGDRNREVPIIAMTAYATPEDEQACYDAGMSGYLSKPVSLREFATMVRSALED